MLKRILIILIAIFIFFGAVYVLLLWPSNLSPNKIDFNFDKSPKFFSVLDGLPVTSTEAQTPGVVAVMIDNFPNIPPQSGLAQAAVVYEAPVEGGLTRYLAVFDRSTNVEQVGPVRSARPYFLDWHSEYGRAIYMHSGGSPEALSIIKKSDYLDANEFYFGAYYWRASDSVAPHNLFTSSELWNKLVAKRFSVTTTLWVGRQFDNSAPTSSSLAVSILIKYGPANQVGWRFDPLTDKYKRALNGKPDSDAGGEVLTADNVVIQYVKMRSLDEIDRKEIVTIDSGSARVLRDGKIIYGQWKKESAESRTIFYNLNGEEIEFKPGVTWIQVVPDEVAVEVIQ